MTQLQTENKLKRTNTFYIVLTGMFTAIICVLSQIQIPTQAIPFSLGLFAIFLTGALLPPRYAFLAVIAYLLLGAVGLPVFAGLKGGLQSLVGPTGGYLAAYPLISLITSLGYKYGSRHKVISLAFGMLLSLFLCYLLGTVWFTILTDNSFFAALNLCVFPFVLFDLLKIVLAISISLILRRTALRSSAI